MKRIISVLISIVMIVSVISVAPITTDAVSAVYGDFKCSVKDGICTIDKYVGDDLYVVIPQTINGYPVGVIGQCAFQNTDILGVSIPNSITKLDHNAFEGCEELMMITIPSSVTYIGLYCFKGCKKLASVTIKNDKYGNGVKEIGGDAFTDCDALESIVLPDSVETISFKVFKSCDNLKKVHFGAGMTTLEYKNQQTSPRYETFEFSYNVESVTVSSKNPLYSSQDGVLYDKAKTSVLYYPPKKADTAYTLPATVKTVGYKSIFNTAYLRELTIPYNTKVDSVAMVGYMPSSPTAMSTDNKKIDGFVIRGFSGTSAHEYAFNQGIAFKQIDLPKSVKLNKTKVTLKGANKSAVQLTTSVTPVDTLTDITWTSSDPNVATVNINGKVVAKNTGKTTITASTFNGKKATCVVTVKAPKSIKLSKTSTTLKKNKKLTLTAKITGTKDNKPTFTTSNSKVVKIVKVTGNKVQVKALKKGKATIKVKTYNGKTASCKITVKNK